MNIQQEYATWNQTPVKKSQTRNGDSTVIQQQMSETDDSQDWADEVSTAGQSDWEEDWNGDGWGKKV